MNTSNNKNSNFYISMSNLLIDFYGINEDILQAFTNIPTITHNNEIYVHAETVKEIYNSFKEIRSDKVKISKPLPLPLGKFLVKI